MTYLKESKTMFDKSRVMYDVVDTWVGVFLLAALAVVIFFIITIPANAAENICIKTNTGEVICCEQVEEILEEKPQLMNNNRWRSRAKICKVAIIDTWERTERPTASTGGGTKDHKVVEPPNRPEGPTEDDDDGTPDTPDGDDDADNTDDTGDSDNGGGDSDDNQSDDEVKNDASEHNGKGGNDGRGGKNRDGSKNKNKGKNR
jgi:hypothetical protein